MKLAAKVILSMLALLLAGAVLLYFFSPEKRAERHFEKAVALEESGDISGATDEYEAALKLYPPYAECRTRAALCYYGMGNYTKAEYHLNRGIEYTPARSENYSLLSKLYVEQDKLLDAIALLDGITDPVANRALSSARPREPAFTPPGGTYTARLEVTVDAETDVFVGRDDAFPTVETPLDGSIPIERGETTIRAVAISAEGLVSPLATALYSIDRTVEEIAFADAGIERIARALLSRPEGPLYSSDLWQISELGNVLEEETVVPVRSLADMAHFRGLRTLRLADTAVDVSTMPSLPALEALSLVRCELRSENLDTFPELPGLISLDLSDNKIVSFAKLPSLPALRELDVSRNVLTDVAPLTGYTSLTTFRADENAISDVTPVMLLRRIETLSIRENRISTVRPLGSVATLRTLDLGENQLTDLTPIAANCGLVTLDVSGNRISSLAPLAPLAELSELRCDRNELASLAGLEDKPLTLLSAASNRIANLAPLANAALLEELTISNNRISSLTPLADAENLHILRVEQNRVTSVAPLASLANLTELHASGNAIEDYDTLPPTVTVYRGE
ncbi:tetratricopeptide repeat protein [Oscillospiraceae bacterium OttesenSCG-928-G22]|nr:tetratricopeptide repeat protein [Oscillospiraceae bacterium OttesenSCG-928-G22]